MGNWTGLWVDGLWILGLAGVVTALSHDGWRRGWARHDAASGHGQNDIAGAGSDVWYSACATLIAVGLLLSALKSGPRAPAWTLIVWGAMVVLSCSTLIATARSVRAHAK